jgi:acylphosphatase
MSRTVHVVISGRVHGVGYRAWTDETARDFGLSGWVRNRRDGSVEAVFMGSESVIEEMLALCLEGPPQAAVSNVESKETDLEVETGFRMLPTA